MHTQRHIHKYVYAIYIHIHMYTRIPNEKEENVLRVRGQESWVYINVTSLATNRCAANRCARLKCTL